MRLSPERTEFLRKNKDKIMAFVQKHGEMNFMGIPRGVTKSGYMCAGVACLSDEERSRITSKDEDMTIADLIKNYELDVTASDRYTMRVLEAAHDDFIMWGDDFTIDDLTEYINKILS